MSRRKETRRRQRVERREREPGEERQAAVASPRKAPDRNISWMGVAGGLAGFLVFAQAVVYVLLVQDSDSKLWAIPPLLLACIYLPAIRESLVATGARQTVLRGTAGVSLAMALLGGFLVDVLLISVLLVPTTLLAIAGGLVFQGGRK